MKIIKLLSASLLLSVCTLQATAAKSLNKANYIFAETPAKTIVIKNPSAGDVNKFFASTTVLMFEVYKAGTAEDLAKIIKSLSSDTNVDRCDQGVLSGDYQAITLTLKSNKDKAYFIKLFKKAGLGTIKINNNAIVAVDQL